MRAHLLRGTLLLPRRGRAGKRRAGTTEGGGEGGRGDLFFLSPAPLRPRVVS